MKEGLEILQPHAKGAVAKTLARAMIGAVEGGLHDIGKNIVISRFHVSLIGAYTGLVDTKNQQ